MRFLLSRVRVIATAAATAIALSTEGVSGQVTETICYPGCGPFDYAGVPTTLTPWVSKSISLPKFDSSNGRELKKVTIRTKVFFETEVFIKCKGNSEVDNTCSTSFTGETNAGVRFGINPSSTNTAALRADLPQYWGRWGDYRPANPNSQFTLADREGKDDQGADFFIPYTYPFFDIPSFVPEDKPDGEEEKVWSYLASDTVKSRLFYATDPTSYDAEGGHVVGFSNINQEGVPETYFDYDTYTGSNIKLLKFGVGTGRTPTPYNTEVSIGKMSFDGTNTPYTKTISLDDYSGIEGGGINNNLTPETMLAYFSDPTSSDQQIVWDTDATGFAGAEVGGGNWEGRQVTTGRAEMQIEYQYTGPALVQGDPQFSGFQGQSFQVHGYPGSYFHLMSAPQFQMNGRFSYIANGHCNYNHTACWTHPGTYIDDIAIIVDELLVRITAGAVGQGYSVRINDEPFHAHAHGVNETSSHTDVREFVPTKFYDAATRVTVHLRSPLEIHIRTDLFALTIHNADHFFNIDSQLLVRPILKMGREPSTKYPHPQNQKQPWFPQFPIHGFIGQTWAKATYPHNKQYQGDVDDYVETRPYATESMYSQYFKKFDEKNMNWEN